MTAGFREGTLGDMIHEYDGPPINQPCPRCAKFVHRGIIEGIDRAVGQLQREVAALRLPAPIIMEAPPAGVQMVDLSEDMEQALIELATSAATYRFAISEERAKMHAGAISDRLRHLTTELGALRAENARLLGILGSVMPNVLDDGSLCCCTQTDAKGHALRCANARAALNREGA